MVFDKTTTQENIFNCCGPELFKSIYLKKKIFLYFMNFKRFFKWRQRCGNGDGDNRVR